MAYAWQMKPLDSSVANYVQRDTSPDGRTVLDLVWCFEPGDFRELGGQRRARIYDNKTEDVVLDLIGRDGGVADFEWEADGALVLQMIDGAGLRVWIERGLYATSGDDWAEHPLADIQANAPAYLGKAEARASAEPGQSASIGLRRVMWIGLTVIVFVAVVAAAWHSRR